MNELGWTLDPNADEPVYEPAFEIWLTPSVGTWEVVFAYDGKTFENLGDDEEGAFLLATQANAYSLEYLNVGPVHRADVAEADRIYWNLVDTLGKGHPKTREAEERYSYLKVPWIRRGSPD